jgi:hypothetical protein
MQTFTLSGNLNIQSSRSVQIQGMVVTNPYGDGIDVNGSSDVVLTFVQSSNNSGTGLSIYTSEVNIAGGGTFNNNGNSGIGAYVNSTLDIIAWGGTVDISNNVGTGLNLDRSTGWGLGPITITNTRAVAGGTYPNGFGINEFGGAKAGLFALFGPISITSNEGGGISLEETSELSMGGNVSWSPYLVTVQGNGPLGIAAVNAGSLTLFGGVTISDHTTAGVSLYGNSQAAITNNQIIHNGTGTDPQRAGIVVDNGSQASVIGVSIQNNGGPGILGRMHATLDVEGSTFAANAAGAIVCDASTALETDLAHSVLGSANACRVSAPGNHHEHGPGNMNLGIPDWRKMKARSMKIGQMHSSHSRNVSPLSK